MPASSNRFTVKVTLTPVPSVNVNANKAETVIVMTSPAFKLSITQQVNVFPVYWQWQHHFFLQLK